MTNLQFFNLKIPTTLLFLCKNADATALTLHSLQLILKRNICTSLKCLYSFMRQKVVFWKNLLLFYTFFSNKLVHLKSKTAYVFQHFPQSLWAYSDKDGDGALIQFSLYVSIIKVKYSILQQYESTLRPYDSIPQIIFYYSIQMVTQDYFPQEGAGFSFYQIRCLPYKHTFFPVDSASARTCHTKKNKFII